MNELPVSLRRYEEELRHAVGRDRRRAVVRRRATRVAAAGVAAAAAALGVLTSLPGGSSAVARAAAALRAGQGTILHVELVGRRVGPDGRVTTWRDERWQEGGDVRRVESTPDGARIETAVAGGVPQLYDAAKNTIYAGRSKADVLAGVARSGRLVKQGDAAAAAKLRDALAKKESALGAPVDKSDAAKEAPASAAAGTGSAEGFRAKVLSLLEAGKAREDGRVEVGGREAIRLSLDAGRTSYLVDAQTYAPVEYDTRGETLRFPVYESLQSTQANLALLSLRAQHPDARVDSDASHYEAAAARLLATG